MSKTVLVVDDSAMMRKIVIRNIDEAGFKVKTVEAEDGAVALKVFMQGGIDIVISDWNMPNMNGLTLIKEIRKTELGKTVPIFMVTTEGSAENVKEAVLAGATNYLVKPFTAEALKTKLAKVIT
jgi:two-component system, chemotaxis family, chemotaxis protein CheY